MADHDPTPGTGPDFEPDDGAPDPGGALYLFTLLATELLLGGPRVNAPARPAATPTSPPHTTPATPEPPPHTAPTAAPPITPGTGAELPPLRPETGQRDLAQALLRVVSALARLGAVARASADATGTATATGTDAAQQAAPRPKRRPAGQAKTPTRCRRGRWAALAAAIAIGVAFTSGRRPDPAPRPPDCEHCGH